MLMEFALFIIHKERERESQSSGYRKMVQRGSLGVCGELTISNCPEEEDVEDMWRDVPTNDQVQIYGSNSTKRLMDVP